MENDFFRQKNVVRAMSPEELTDYIQVSKPGIWLLLAAVAVLLVGMTVWACVGKLETTVSAAAMCENDGTLTIYVKEEYIDSISVGDIVRVLENECEIPSIPSEPIAVDDTFEDYALYVGGLRPGEWVFPIVVKAPLADGVYTVSIVTDSVSPITFLLS